MAERTLNDSNVDAGLDQERRRRVPQHVRRDPTRQPGIGACRRNLTGSTAV
jgi:hypothetical protein